MLLSRSQYFGVEISLTNRVELEDRVVYEFIIKGYFAKHYTLTIFKDDRSAELIDSWDETRKVLSAERDMLRLAIQLIDEPAEEELEERKNVKEELDDEESEEELDEEQEDQFYYELSPDERNMIIDAL